MEGQSRLKGFEKSALILAGGRGARFWPLSRLNKPKQLHDLLNIGIPIIEATIQRLNNIVSKEQIFLSTRSDLKESILKLNIVDETQVFLEPTPQNTAPAIAMAAATLFNKYGDRILITLPSDHYVYPIETFQKQLLDASEVAWDRGSLVCFGIPPNRAATGYGYLQMSECLEKNAFLVTRFVEKPNKETAEEYIKLGNYYWNAGIFVCRLSSILEAIQMHLPKLWKQLAIYTEFVGTAEEENARNKFFLGVDPISIDYGVMEHHNNVLGIKAAFEWDDLGTWDSLKKFLLRLGDNWTSNEDITALNARENIIYANGKRIVLLDVENLIIVDTKDTLFITERGSAEKVGDIISLLPNKD